MNGKWVELIDCAETALNFRNTKENNIVFMNHKGVALQKLEKYEEAAITFDETLNLDSNNFTALLHSGLCLKELRYYDRAIECLKKALTSHSNEDLVLHMIADCYSLVGHKSVALEYIDKSLKLDQKNANGLYLKGCLLKDLNRTDDALNCFNNAIDLSQELWRAHYDKILLLKN